MTWKYGERFSKETVQAYTDKAVLKLVVYNNHSYLLTGANHNTKPEIEDCADVFITIAKNTSTTGQQIQVG